MASANTTPQPSPYAYVTFLPIDGDCVKGVIGLLKGLRKVKSAYPLVVAVSPDMPKEHLKNLKDQGCVVQEIEPLNPPKKESEFTKGNHLINYSKLCIWKFVEYSKMIYLDANVQVLENIDHLFELEDGRIHAVMDCFCQKSWSHTPQHAIGYCHLRSDKQVQWPDEMGPCPPFYFNAGMFVFQPSLTIYDKLLRTLGTTPPTPFAEQAILNEHFSERYTPIVPKYNLGLSMLWHHPENFELERVKVVRYDVAGSKPWIYTGKEKNKQRDDVKMLVEKWRDIYEDESLDYKNSASMAGEAEAERVNMELVIGAPSEADAAQHGVTAPSAA